ncbi:hypothetical protein BUALT_Bualt05G0161000 [Buddleja alternifolia]|uniref:DUF4283 domain-containing protein n=1 Tax=Buddleja alternifolia TaxID=168488 RepID=A0AAV6XSW0_9LAMI|nr:hypothetical protein BUALT_Bualt05G0161000 [Buddleja alternifolia]
MDPPSTADPPGPATTFDNNIIDPKSSYAEKLKANPRPKELTERAARKTFIHGVDSKVIRTTTLVNGKKTIFLSKEEDDFMAAPYQYSLVGIFSHGYPTMTRLRAKITALGLFKGFKIGVLDQKHVWIRLFDPNDYARIWLKQTWYFDGFPMRVLKWTSEFDPNEESPIMPIWIKVFGLKPHWFHRQFLFHVASLIGKPLKLDEATTEIDNPSVARICVEVNVIKKLQSEIPIQVEENTRFLKIQYEGIPEYCKICRHRGHSLVACMVQKENTEVDAGIKQSEDNVTKTGELFWKEKEDLRAKLDKKKRVKKPMEQADLALDNSNGVLVNPVRILARKINKEVQQILEDSGAVNNVKVGQ